MKCKWCKKKAHVKQGSVWLCKKHYRFMQMRVNAKRNKKTVPPYEELEKILLPNCPVCKRKFNWLSKEGAQTVITLQHDRSGAFRFLCLSCNVRYASFKDDSFYSQSPKTKICPKCKKEKPWSEYHTDNSARWKNKKTYCKDCSYLIMKNWKLKNKEAFNAKRREYYHRRKESGNPIPR